LSYHLSGGLRNHERTWFRTGTSLIEVEGLFPAAFVNDILQSHSGAYFLALSDRFITTFWYAVPSAPFMVYVLNSKFMSLFRSFL
jgi:hypothetical protein